MSNWPAANARRQAEFVERKLIPAAIREHGLDAFGQPVRAAFLVFVEGFSPLVPLEHQLEEERRQSPSGWPPRPQPMETKELAEWLPQNLKFYSEVVELLRSGAGLDLVREKLQREQAWPCFAVAADRAELERELQLRYKRGKAETDFLHFRIPDGVLISCRVLPRAWR